MKQPQSTCTLISSYRLLSVCVCVCVYFRLYGAFWGGLHTPKWARGHPATCLWPHHFQFSSLRAEKRRQEEPYSPGQILYKVRPGSLFIFFLSEALFGGYAGVQGLDNRFRCLTHSLVMLRANPMCHELNGGAFFFFPLPLAAQKCSRPAEKCTWLYATAREARHVTAQWENGTIVGRWLPWQPRLASFSTRSILLITTDTKVTNARVTGKRQLSPEKCPQAFFLSCWVVPFESCSFFL